MFFVLWCRGKESDVHDLGSSARELARLVVRTDDAHLDAATPCADWTGRDLAQHLLGLSAHFATVARKQPGAGAPETLPDGWRDVLVAQLDDLVVAWRDPEAWVGDGEAGGVRMPTAQLGIVALEEVVLHGWDLAALVGDSFSVTEDDVIAVEGFVEGFADVSVEQRAGLYGPVADVPSDASRFERVLALAGRDARAVTSRVVAATPA
jgi:uncharacterized protein (TIGR03086 family)